MPQSLTQIYLHVVFSTKERARYFQSEALRCDLHAYLAKACNNMNANAIIVGGAEDHIHVACSFPRQLTVSNFMRDLKRESSKWIKTQRTDLASFAWQDGFAAFSLSPSHLETIKVYIANQMEHHRKESFQAEMRRVFQKYDVTFDEKYVWG